MKVNTLKEGLLTQARLKEVLEYNTMNGVFVWLTKPHQKAHRIKVGQIAGTITRSGYARITIDGYFYLSHRLAWLYTYGYFPSGDKPFLDHVDGIPSNNRIENLRVVSSAENNRNRKIGSTNSSGLVGVSRVEIPVKRGDKIYTYWSWRAYWQDESGKQQKKDFYIHTYGEDKAEQMAISTRIEQIRLLEVNHNITYSDRHGV